MKKTSTDDSNVVFLLTEEKIFENLFKTYFPRLKSFSFKFVVDQDVAEDLVQEVFLKIWENRGNIRVETFHSYVFTMVRNSCLNYIKHKNIVGNTIDEGDVNLKEEALYYVDFFSDPHHQTIFNELKQEIAKVMDTFPEQTRIIFELSRFKGLKNHEIADTLGVTQRTVEKHITRALMKFRSHFPETYLIVLVLAEILQKIN